VRAREKEGGREGGRERERERERGDGGKPKPGTNSISTGTKIVLVRKKNIPLIKNDKPPTSTYPETRNG